MELEGGFRHFFFFKVTSERLSNVKEIPYEEIKVRVWGCVAVDNIRMAKLLAQGRLEL